MGETKKLLVIKIGTTSLTEKNGDISQPKIVELIRQVADLKDMGHSVVLVSSGAIAAGFRRLGYKERPHTVAGRQAAAAVGQGLLMEEYTKLLLDRGYVGAQLLITRFDFSDRQRYKNIYQAIELLLKKGAVPIINENDTVAVEELCFGDNDRLAAEVAGMVHADLLLLLTDIDGLYTADPQKDPAARPIELVENIDAELEAIAGGSGSRTGTGGMRSKVEAAKVAALAGVPMFICRAGDPDAMVKALHREINGTYFKPGEHKLKTRLQWLAFCSASEGNLFIDDGAVTALEQNGKSLLPSGIRHISGQFEAGAVVEVKSLDGRYIGKGICNYSAKELEILTASMGDRIIAKEVAIHRNNWVGATKTTV